MGVGGDCVLLRALTLIIYLHISVILLDMILVITFWSYKVTFGSLVMGVCVICSRDEVKCSEVPTIFIIVCLGNKLTTTPLSVFFLESTYMLFSNNYVLVFYVLRTLVLIDEILLQFPFSCSS